MAIKKKKVIPRRPKTGLAAAPLDDFEKLKYYMHYELDKKPAADLVKGWIKKNFKKNEQQAILATPDYNFNMYSYFVAGVHWLNSGLELPEKFAHLPEYMRNFYKDLIPVGSKILAEKTKESTEVSNVVPLNPHQRLLNKINDTIMYDLDDLVDAWLAGQEPEFDVYARFKIHELPGSATEPVRKVLEQWLSEFNDAYNKTCDQAVEGYAHVPRPVMRRRIKLVEGMISDLEKVKASAKATRKPRAPKTRAADKQVSKMNYLKEDNTFKLTSVQPITIVGSMRLYVFNVKTREITEYVSDSTSGFEVKGTSLKNFSSDSRKTKLRKPEEFLAAVLSKTPKQIDNEWNKLTTKSSLPNGRINGDCILLRAMDR